MFEIFREEKEIAIAMAVFWGLSILMKILLGVLYQNMIREVENMATTKHKLLKQCKLKFANCYRLNNGVFNTQVFVDKFLGRLALGNVSFESLYHLSGQVMLLSIVCAGVGICKSIIEGRMLGEILPFYIVSFLELYLYFSISTMLNINGRKQNLKVCLVDYLDNHLSARIGTAAEDMEMLYGPEAPRAGAYGPVRRRGSSLTERKAGAGGRKTVEYMPISSRQIAREQEQGRERETAEAEAGAGTVGQASAAATQQEDNAFNPQKVSYPVTLDPQELEDLLQEFFV